MSKEVIAFEKALELKHNTMFMSFSRKAADDFMIRFLGFIEKKGIDYLVKITQEGHEVQYNDKKAYFRFYYPGV